MRKEKKFLMIGFVKSFVLAICSMLSTAGMPLRLASQDAAAGATEMPGSLVLKADSFKHYIDTFNKDDEELFIQYIPNEKAWEFLKTNIPLFECPDKDFELTYYFRWWTYRKHIKETPDGFVITEFLPKVSWGGKHNEISCAAGHHFYEGRWLHDAKYLDDYAVFWFQKGGAPRRYSCWIADALYARYLVRPDKKLGTILLDDLVRNYKEWEKERLEPDGLFWQIDDRDGMEFSISGSGGLKMLGEPGKRPSINSYMFGDAIAISKIAALAGRKTIAEEYQAKAEKLKQLIQTKLWNDREKFFMTLPRDKETLVNVREEIGWTPWYFNLPEQSYEEAWKELMDPKGFYAPFGPTTAEQRHPQFAVRYEGHSCQWNGPSWPYATSITLTALANVLNNYKQDVISCADYFETLKIYTKSHRLKRENGQVVAWIDENLNPYTGDWIARTRLSGSVRGKDYNHSTYCDLVISGLVGLRPRPDDVVEVNPLLPQDTWDWFCLDNVLYHGRIITILWDKTGKKYNRGTGLRVFADGKEVAQADPLQRVTGKLRPAAVSDASISPTQDFRAVQGATARRADALAQQAGWRKYENNPVLGGNLGTCFDVAVLKEKSKYRMWFSWRPKKSIALVESTDGIHWGDPEIVLGPRPDSTWEHQVNRPVVVKRDNLYHIWYTGQASGRSCIGYATSTDGHKWKRTSDKPVLSPEEPWENVAVMCPHVLWDTKEGLYRMWYSAGEQYEPNAIGYATSSDGRHWSKLPSNPVFTADPNKPWEQHKVTACQVIHQGQWYLMFYIGFRDEDHAQIGLARSRDGIANWQRYTNNPIISPVTGSWDADACYKPFAIFEGNNNRWLLWYNGRKGTVEQIGLAIHDGEDLGFLFSDW